MSAFRQWFSTMTLGQTSTYLRLLRWCFLDSFVASIPYAIMVLAVYFLLVPVAHPGQPMPTSTLWLLVGILGLQFLAYLFIRRKSYLDFSIGFVGSTKASRLEMGEHLRTLGMGFYNERDAGDVSTVLLRDYTEIETFAQQLLPQIATILIRFALALVVLPLFSIPLTLACLAVVPLALPFAILSSKRMQSVSGELQLSQQQAASGILEYIGGLQTLKAFNLAGTHFETLRDSLDRQRAASVHLETKAAAPVSMIGRAILNCGIGLVMLTGGLLLTGGALHPFYHIAFLLLSLTIYDPILTLFTFIADFARTTRSGNRIRSLFETKPLPEPDAAQAREPHGNDIEFRNVSFAYDDVPVLENVNLSIPEHSVTALVGPSGSGKSTMVRLIARFWDVGSGEVLLGGAPVSEMSSDAVLARVSMVFQDVYLFHDTIEANIRMGKLDATHDEVVDAAKRAACHDFICRLPNGYETLVGEGGSTLSGGEAQRISIARALLKDAPIVLLDEATSSLDPGNEVLIQQAISALVKDKTVVVIAHRLQSVHDADKIVVLADGHVAEEGGHGELLAQGGLYARLWNEQANARSWQISHEDAQVN